jgi:superfamily II DNA/RNA helicase
MPQRPIQRSSRPTSSAPKGGAKGGSKSPKHRGYKPVEDAPKKQRWNADERAAKGRTPDRRDAQGTRDERPAAREDRRPDWRPYEKPTRPAGQGGRAPFRGDDRPARSYDDRAPRSNDRAPRSYDDRASRSNDRAPRSTDRPARSYDDRAPRSNDRAARSYDDRAPRSNDRAPRSYDDRAPRSTDRPARSYDDRAPRANDRAPRSYDDRAPRSYSDRPARSNGDRPARPYSDRPARSSDDRSARPYGDRSARSNDRAPRGFDDRRDHGGARSWEDHPVRRESSFYPDRDKASEVLDDVVLEKLSATAVEAIDVDGTSFGDLGLGQNIVRVLAELGAPSPFPIQAATIPDVLAGRDVLGRGRTGSGKTIAFGAPLVERLLLDQKGEKRRFGRAPRAIIMAPTRELALQIDATVQPIARSVGLFTTQIYGGVPQARQVGALQKGVDIIVGTPGRIEDLHRQGRLDLSEIRTIVLDEADHMCELGFLEPVQRILRLLPTDSQKLLFSATLDSRVAALVEEFLVEPAVYEVAGEDQASSTIEHRVLLIEQRDKRDLVAELAGGANRTIVFTRTRAFAEELADGLDQVGIRAVALHGDLNQAKRTRNLERLTSGRVNVLVATDVAARGIHVDDITLVIQADAPEEYKTYLHRAGRTGRAGKPGTVVTLVPRGRRRKVDELLGRAEITASYDEVRPGDQLVKDLSEL